MKSIIIIGYMGAGKTTVGKALAKELGVMFYDLDWYIESRMRKTVKQIFDEIGEEGFRKIERNMLHEVAEFENVVVSCGGGTPCFFDNMDYMNSVGQTFYLKASTETIVNHLAMSRGERPLLKGKSPEELRDFVGTQLAEREAWYAKASEVVNVDVLDSFSKIELVVDDIAARIN